MSVGFGGMRVKSNSKYWNYLHDYSNSGGGNNYIYKAPVTGTNSIRIGDSNVQVTKYSNGFNVSSTGSTSTSHGYYNSFSVGDSIQIYGSTNNAFLEVGKKVKLLIPPSVTDSGSIHIGLCVNPNDGHSYISGYMVDCDVTAVGSSPLSFTCTIVSMKKCRLDGTTENITSATTYIIASSESDAYYVPLFISVVDKKFAPTGTINYEG